MKDNRTNALIAGVALVAALLMTLALSFAIGKWSFGNSGNKITIKFPVATGITPNAEVKIPELSLMTRWAAYLEWEREDYAFAAAARRVGTGGGNDQAGRGAEAGVLQPDAGAG